MKDWWTGYPKEGIQENDERREEREYCLIGRPAGIVVNYLDTPMITSAYSNNGLPRFYPRFMEKTGHKFTSQTANFARALLLVAFVVFECGR